MPFWGTFYRVFLEFTAATSFLLCGHKMTISVIDIQINVGPLTLCNPIIRCRKGCRNMLQVTETLQAQFNGPGGEQQSNANRKSNCKLFPLRPISPANCQLINLKRPPAQKKPTHSNRRKRNGTEWKRYTCVTNGQPAPYYIRGE